MKSVHPLPTLALIFWYIVFTSHSCFAKDDANDVGIKVIPSSSNTYTARQVFDTLDVDHNSKINMKDFYAMDLNHDGEVSWTEFTNTLGSSSKTKKDKEPGDFLNAFTSSTAMIIATEIGDKTFFIAAVLSMRNPRLLVFGGAILALYCMTTLSTMMGLILPSLIPRSYTHIIGGILFLYFGIKLIYDSRSMSDRVSEELEEVEEELLKTNKKSEAESADDEENGSAVSKEKSSNSKSESSIFFQSFILTFLAEWGDRSQIATIALAASKDPLGVTIGGCFGHSLCTGMAVIGGRLLASKISEKTVSFWGGVTFLAFGVHALVFSE